MLLLTYKHIYSSWLKIPNKNTSLNSISLTCCPCFSFLSKPGFMKTSLHAVHIFVLTSHFPVKPLQCDYPHLPKKKMRQQNHQPAASQLPICLAFSEPLCSICHHPSFPHWNSTTPHTNPPTSSYLQTFFSEFFVSSSFFIHLYLSLGCLENGAEARLKVPLF